MKRGNDEESTMGPMFPRLHVNDAAEKGGPRAPPRNKMALYEQLSIPSQRFANPQTKPRLHSPSQGSGGGIKRQFSSSTTTTWSEKFTAHHRNESDSVYTQFEQSKKIRDDDDFTVPVFNQPRMGKIQNSNNRGTISSISSRQISEPTKPGDFHAKGAQETSDQDLLSNFTMLVHESRGRAKVDSSIRNDDLVHSTRCHKRLEELDDDTERDSNSNRVCVSLSVDKVEEVSDISMVESISRVDITPDDVVGIIGQKRFWEARKAIVNQQRVFAVQVFELHRLIKVQRLIAGSPNIFSNEGVSSKSVVPEKPSTKDSPITKLPMEFVVKPIPVIANSKDHSEKPSRNNNRNECSASTSIGKSNISSVKNGGESTSHGSHMGTNNNKTNPWYFHQPQGPQWLVPVMTPSDGLVYKPFSGPGAPGVLYGGGYGSFAPIPMMGNYPNPAMGSCHGTAQVGPMYFQPIPVPNPAMSSGSAFEQARQFAGPCSQSQTGPVVAEQGKGNSNMDQQSSCSGAKVFPGSEGTDVQQGSTASSGREMSKRVGAGQNAKRKDPLSLGTGGDNHQPTRAIKVVPHNPRSATESAARIFRFIQEERKLYDSA